MTDDDTRALPLEPRTSPIPLRKQPPVDDHRSGQAGQSRPGVVVPIGPAPCATDGGLLQGYPEPNHQQEFQGRAYPRQGQPQQGYPAQGPRSYWHGPGGYPPNQHPQQVAYGPPPSYDRGYQSTVMIARPAPNGALIAVAWIVAILTLSYMLPWAVAATRGKPNQGAVGLLNFFLGWSFIGWVVALVMACTSQPQPIVMVQQNHYGNGYHR